MAGGAFLRVDVPAFNGGPAFTRFFGPSAIYSISPVTEEIARGLMDRYRNEPVSRFELPQLAEKVDPISRPGSLASAEHQDFREPNSDAEDLDE